MNASIDEHKEIINLLGGGKKLTARLKLLSNESINEKTVYSWVRQGIPDKWKVAVSRCLLEDNIDIRDYKNLLPPGLHIDNLFSANNSIKIFSSSKVLISSMILLLFSFTASAISLIIEKPNILSIILFLS